MKEFTFCTTSLAVVDPRCISLQGIIEQNVREEMAAIYRKLETTDKEVTDLVRWIHHGYYMRRYDFVFVEAGCCVTNPSLL